MDTNDEMLNVLCVHAEYPTGWHVLGDLGNGNHALDVLRQHLLAEQEYEQDSGRDSDIIEASIRIVRMSRSKYESLPVY